MSGLSWLKTVNAILLILITFVGTIDFNKLPETFAKLSANKNLILIILATIYIISYIIEVSKTQKVDILNRTIKMHEDSNHKLSSACEDFSQEFYSASNSLRSVRKLELHWSFRLTCKTICSTILKTIENYNPNLAFEISYTQRLNDNTTKMIYWDEDESNSDMPSIYGREVPIQTASQYFYEKFFLNGIREVVSYKNRKEIEKNFIHQPKDDKKYLQYIGVPLLCPDGNIFGLLQFIVKKDNEKNTKLSDFEFKAIKLYLECCRSKLILFSKLEKLLTIRPYQKNKSI